MKNIDLIKLESSENIKSLKTSPDSIISWYEKDALGNVSLKYKINNEIKDITSDIKSELSSKLTIPSGGNKNDVLTKTESGFKWTSQSEVQSNLSGDEKTIQISGDVISVKTIEENQVLGLIDDLNSKQDKISESNNLDYSLISGEPTSLSAFTNDPNYQTLENVNSLISRKADKDDLNSKQDKISETNKLDYKFISGEPTSLSAFTNDLNYQTLDNVKDLISGKAEADDIPTMNDSKITITQGGVEKGSFTLNQNVSGSIDIDSVDLTNYLTFTAEEAGSTIALSGVGNPDPVTLEYKINDSAWSLYTINDMITLTNKGDKVRFRAGINKNKRFAKDFDNNYHKFVMTGRIAASGSINTLLDRNDNIDDLTGRDYCYYYMFYGCTNLTSAPELPATTLASYCYSNMFLGCSSLTTAPELPATTLGYECYYYMFYGCTSLTTAPELPATTLASWCYSNMFWECTSLTNAPELPATTLDSSCYEYMFYGCTGLNKVSVKFTDWSTDLNATTDWLNGVAQSGTFTCPAALNTAIKDASHVPSGWSVKEISKKIL